MTTWITLIVVLMMAAWFILPRLSWISARDAAQRLNQGALLVDVRSPAEHRSSPLPDALNLPLGQLASDIKARGIRPDQPLLLFCASGTRSAMAARQLRSMGFQQVWNLGTHARASAALQSR